MAAIQQDMASAYTPRGIPSHQKQSAQVIVVGGGLSGLQAAYNLQRAGATCLVLEARGVIGGRPGDDVFSATNHTRVAELARGLGLEIEQQEFQGQDVVEGFGASDPDGIPNLNEDDRRSFIRVRDNIEELSQRVDVNRPAELLPNYGAMNFHELVVSQGGLANVQTLANSWTSAIFGLASKDVSALYFLLYCKCAGGLLQVLSEMRSGFEKRLHVQGGVDRLCAELAVRLQPGTVHLSQVVERVDQSPGNKVVVTTQTGATFQCTKLIVAGTERCTSIGFAPELSGDKLCVLEAAKHGFSKRVALLYTTPWWQERGLSGYAQGLSGPISLIKASSRDDGLYMLTCFVTGEPGRELWQMVDGERQQALLRHVEAIFGGDDLPVPFGLEDLDANVLSAVPAANLRNLEQDHWRPEGHVYFAGEQTSYVWVGHAEGALASASHVAEEVICALHPTAETMCSRL